MSLIKNNAKVAAQIAVALDTISSDDESHRDFTLKTESKPEQELFGKSNKVAATPLVIGGSILDVHYRVKNEDLMVSLECLEQKKRKNET